MPTGPRNLITDVPGLRVGNASDDTLKSGVTCLVGDRPFVAAVDIRGGAPGTRETDLLDPDKTVETVDALVLSGGSAFGLDAASGVMEALHKDGRGFAVGDVRVPIVPAAILFDLINGGEKGWEANPYAALGRQAYENAGAEFAIGSVGAGTGATTARLKGGLGSASWRLPSGHIVGALVAANPVGCVTPAGDPRFWAGVFEHGQEFGGLGSVAPGMAEIGFQDTKLAHLAPHQTSTTIGVVATDLALTKAQAKRMAVAAHDGYARSILPAHTPHDGDLIFAASTGQSAGADEADLVLLGHVAAQCMARAVARAIYSATPSHGDLRPCWKDVRQGT